MLVSSAYSNQHYLVGNQYVEQESTIFNKAVNKVSTDLNKRFSRYFYFIRTTWSELKQAAGFEAAPSTDRDV